MGRKRTTVIEIVMWTAVIIAAFYSGNLTSNHLETNLGLLAALVLAAYWTIRAYNARVEAAVEKQKIQKENDETELQKERLETLFDLTHDGVIVVDEHNKILDANTAVIKMMGYARNEIIHKSCGEIFRCDKHKDIGLCFGFSMLNIKEPVYCEDLFLVDKDGQPIDIEARFTKSATLKGHKSAGLILIRDLSKIRQAEALEHDFVSMTSHQLYTPLSIIRGHLSLLLEENAGPVNARQRDFIEQSLQSTKKMVHLVSELLSISRLEERKIVLNFAPTDIISTIKSTISEMNSLAKKKSISITFSPGHRHVSPIIIDGEKISQVIQNLIDNSIKYSNYRGKILVSLKPEKDNLLITVQDTGIGIPKEEISRLFQRFYRSSNAVNIDSKGTGLGLYIARVIVERHHGNIWAESDTSGTTFSISLPK